MTTRSMDVLQAGLVLLCGCTLAAAGAALEISSRSSGTGVEGTLGLGLALVGLVVIGVWFLALALAIASELLRRTGRSTAARLVAAMTPALMRRLAVAVLGVNLLAVPAMAQAAPSGPDPSVAVSVGETRTGADQGPLGALPSGRTAADAPRTTSSGTGTTTGTLSAETGTGAPADRPVSPAWEPVPLPVDGSLLLRQGTRAEHRPTEVVVAPGDSLWSIVATRLGPMATAAEVAETWPAWFEANRRVIGDDPSLLRPGQLLQAPPP